MRSCVGHLRPFQFRISLNRESAHATLGEELAQKKASFVEAVGSSWGLSGCWLKKDFHDIDEFLQ